MAESKKVYVYEEQFPEIEVVNAKAINERVNIVIANILVGR